MIQTEPISNTVEFSQKLESKADIVQYKKRQVIYAEHGTPLGVYIILEGKVKITKTSIDGKEQILRIASNGEPFGLVDLAADSAYGATAEALEDTRISFVPRWEFWNIVHGSPELFEELLRLVSAELKLAEEKMADLAYKPVKVRLADALLELETKFDPARSGKKDIYLSRYDLACYIGTAKETVNRIMSELRDENLVSTHGWAIHIEDRGGLEKISKMYV
ncbi:MAG: Crp/Fnr family transcriptional regulator [Crocinitomicaceae bacterium]|nr:Crp/Fnr family transcriptional regulator [Crocinitomicaceae bacterium]